MWHFTKTKDEQDPLNPFKPFPNYEYFDVLHYLAEVLFIEKSRTMMASWWAVAEDIHYVMTHPPATAIFWA